LNFAWINAYPSFKTQTIPAPKPKPKTKGSGRLAKVDTFYITTATNKLNPIFNLYSVHLVDEPKYLWNHQQTTTIDHTR
jgi:hypothetical protein